MNSNYLEILHSELIPALGCTEPIAVAFAAAKARSVLGTFPDKLELHCSGNVIKNVKGVTVPNSGGLIGLDVAAVLGTVCGCADRELQVLEDATEEDIARTQELIRNNYVICILEEGVENLYIRAVVSSGEHTAEVIIEKKHNLITHICKDGVTLYHHNPEIHTEKYVDKSTLSIRGILEFAESVSLESVQELLDRQIEMNSRIADEGLRRGYGAQIGQTLLDTEGENVIIRARARAAAGSDARMSGCSLPVVINSGSGNQGMTLSLPVIEYAKELHVDREKLYRALVVSNLTAIHIKRYIGSLSAFCGAVSAACAAGAAITYLHGGSYDQICTTIVNTLGNTSGIICDGAKPSCAAKIACAVEGAILAHNMSMMGRSFQPGEGLIREDIEDTIKSIGYVARVGMKNTDVEVLNVMIDRIKVCDM